MLLLWVFTTVTAWSAEGWTVLQVDQVHVRCRDVAGGSECEATARLQAAVDPVCDIIRNLPDWPRIFDNVSSAESLGEGDDRYALNVRLPFPLGTRSMVARVEHSDDGVGHHSISLRPIAGDALWTSASWHVTQMGEETEVSYRWHTEALSRLPGWIRRGLLRRTGHNVMWGIAMAAHSRPVAPPALPARG